MPLMLATAALLVPLAALPAQEKTEDGRRKTEVQAEAQTEAQAEAQTEGKLGIQGEIRNDVEFQVEAELQPTDPWRDVYADFKHYDAVRVRGGHFKLPFSLDELTSPTHLDFMFRSLAATHLAPGRDTGVMVHGRVVNKTINYEAGVFNHDGKNARTSNADKVYGGTTFVARVTYQPMRDVKDANTDVSVGGAYATSDVPEGIPGLRGLMVYDQKFFSASNYIVNGKRASCRDRPRTFPSCRRAARLRP